MDSSMSTIAIPVPKTIVTALNMELDEIASAMRREYAFELYQGGKLTLSQAAELCGVDIYDFMTLLSRASIPVIDYTAEELEEDCERLRTALA